MTRYSPMRGRNLTRWEAFTERFAMSGLGYRFLLHVAPRIDGFLLPRTKGRWSSTGKDRFGFLTATGAKSGEARSVPLLVIPEDDGGFLLVGSNYGREHHPGWTANLRAHPRCTLAFQGEEGSYHARELDGDERAAAWERALDAYAGYALYETRAHPRVIRLFRLESATE